MAYDRDNPPALIAQATKGAAGQRYYSWMWVDPIATILTPGYISNGQELGMRAGDTVTYKDTNRGEWDEYHLLVDSIAANGSVTLKFPEVPPEALPEIAVMDDTVDEIAVYHGGRLSRILGDAFIGAATYLFNLTGAVRRTILSKLSERMSVLDFGAVGNCTGAGLGTDDTAAIQLAFNWWAAASSRELVFPGGYRWRMSGTATATLSLTTMFNKLTMLSPVTPDAVAGNTIEIISGSFLELRLQQEGGGVDADYTQADPSGGQQTFYLRGMRNAYIELTVQVPFGRVMRTAVEHAGENKTSNLTWGFISFNSDGSHGQMLYAQGSSSFGHLLDVHEYYPKYGSIFDTVADLAIGIWEGGVGSITTDAPLTFLNCTSLHAHSFAYGSIATGKAIVFNGVLNSHVHSCFAAGTVGVTIENCGDSAAISAYSVSFDNIETVSCTQVGIALSNSFGVKIGRHSSFADLIGTTITGCQRIWAEPVLSRAETTGYVVDSTSSNIVINGGSSNNGNFNNVSSTPMFDIQTTGLVIIRDFLATGNHESVLYNLVASNNTRIFGGEVTPAGGGAVFGANLPKQAKDISGYITMNSGASTLTAGTTSITVNHGLAAAPIVVMITPRTANATIQQLATNTYTSTQFNAVVTSSVVVDVIFNWQARMSQADG